jgi:hypothetical protein
MTLPTQHLIETLPPPWIQFPAPESWIDWVKPDAINWYQETWFPAWHSFSIKGKIAYTKRWHVPGLCFFMQMEWTMQCVSRNKGRCINLPRIIKDIYPDKSYHGQWLGKIIFGVLRLLFVLLFFCVDKIRCLIRLFFPKFGKTRELLEYVPMQPVDDYALPTPWVMGSFTYGSSVWAYFRAILTRNREIVYAHNEIWFIFWQTLDAQQRQAYQARWPRHPGWERFLEYATEEGVLAPQQELRWGEVWDPLFDRVKQEKFYFEEIDEFLRIR